MLSHKKKSKTKILPLHHIALKVKKLAPCVEFYKNILGLEICDEKFDAAGKLRSVWLKSAKIILMIELDTENKKLSLPAAPVSQSSLGWHLVAFSISATERLSWKQKLNDAKIKIESESEYSLYFRDPEGNRVAISHYPKTQK